MNTKDIITLARSIAPDLRWLPIYVLRSSEGFPHSLMPPNALGFTGPYLDVTAKSWLGSSWRGRGIAFGLNDILMSTYQREFGYEFCSLFITTVLHELAHAVSREIRLPPIDQERQSMLVAATEAWAATPSPTTSAPWIGHDAHWMRVVIHMFHRAHQELGQYLPLSLAVPSGIYGLSPCQYRIALGDEPEQLSHLTFAELNAIVPPDPFCDLWNRDAQFWFNSLESPELADLETLARAKRLFSGSSVQPGQRDQRTCEHR